MLIFSVLKTFGNRAALLPKAQFMTACMNIASPIVTMMTEMIGSPTRGRSRTTCTRMPKRVVKTSANANAATNGNCHFTMKYQQIHAPSTRNSPCAKLTTWVDL